MADQGEKVELEDTSFNVDEEEAKHTEQPKGKVCPDPQEEKKEKKAGDETGDDSDLPEAVLKLQTLPSIQAQAVTLGEKTLIEYLSEKLGQRFTVATGCEGKSLKEMFVEHNICKDSFPYITLAHLNEMCPKIPLGDKLALLSIKQDCVTASRISNRRKIIMQGKCTQVLPMKKDADYQLTNSMIKFIYTMNKTRFYPKEKHCCGVHWPTSEEKDHSMATFVDIVDLTVITDVDYKEVTTKIETKLQKCWGLFKCFGCECTQEIKTEEPPAEGHIILSVNQNPDVSARRGSPNTRNHICFSIEGDAAKAKELVHEIRNRIEEVQFQEGGMK